VIAVFKSKQRRTGDNTATDQDVPAEVNDTSADVSEAAECCVADIDDVLSDMDDAMESEEDKARREADELWTRFSNQELTEDEYWKQRNVIRAKYAHLNLGGCWC
jgi:hypothetical protein